MSLDYNRQYGKYRVKYPDGVISMKFCGDVAAAYQRMFGGEIMKIK
jgi:hypothetical protein